MLPLFYFVHYFWVYQFATTQDTLNQQITILLIYLRSQTVHNFVRIVELSEQAEVDIVQFAISVLKGLIITVLGLTIVWVSEITTTFISLFYQCFVF